MVYTLVKYLMEAVKIILADNQYLTRKGVLDYFKNTSFVTDIHQVFNKDELFESISKLRPRLLLIDFDSFDFNSLDDLVEIKKISPETTIIILTNNTESSQIEKILELGINHYVLKTADIDELELAIQSALNHKKFFSEEILDLLVSKKNKTKSGQYTSHLTHSEIEIIKLIAQGLTTKEIAAKKVLSFHTIITHRKNIFRKLEINNTSELVSFAYKSGLIDNTEYYI